MLNHADLPDDIDALKALLLAFEQTLRERDAVILAHDELVAGLRAQLITTEVEIEHLKLMIAKLRRMQFGRNPRSSTTRSNSWNCSWRTCRPPKARPSASARRWQGAAQQADAQAAAGAPAAR